MLDRKLKLAIFFASVLMPVVSFAQVERFPGVVDKVPAETEIPKSHSLDATPAQPIEQAPEIKKVDNAEKVLATLKSVTFDGNTVLKEENLQAIVSKYVDQPLTNGKLAELKYEVKKAYYDQGYILVHVVTQPQDFSQGVLKVSIYEAQVGDVEIQTNGVVQEWLPAHIAKVAKKGEVIREVNAETMINDIDDLYGAGASLVLRPGKEFKTTDLLVNMRKEDDDNNRVGVNNYGSDLTGEIVAYGHLEHSNLAKMGEKISLDLQRSEDDLWTAGVGLELPTGLRNINLETSYLHSENEIGGRLEALHASGETDIFDVALSSKIINTRVHTVKAKFGLQNRTHESFLSDIQDTKDDLNKVYTDVSYLYRGLAQVFYADAKLSKGVDGFGANDRGDAKATRALGNQDSWIFEPTLVARARPFNVDGTVKAIVRGQISSNTLLSSDLFSIGGYGSVRGFDVSQEAAENGYSFTLQYDHVIPLNIPKTTISFGPFFDGGAINNRVQGSVEDTHFYSAGLGLQADLDLVPAGDTVVRLDWAHPVGSYRSTKVSDDTFYFNVSQGF